MLQESFFTPLAGGGVTVKTTNAQRSATFDDAESAYAGTQRLLEMLGGPVPLYALFSETQDLW